MELKGLIDDEEGNKKRKTLGLKTKKEKCGGTLQVTHEGTTEIKSVGMNILTHEYELLIMKPEENVYDMHK